jgi:hypothetical protein
LPSRVSSKVAALAMSLLINSMPCAWAQDGTTPPSQTTKPSDTDFLKDYQPATTTTPATTTETAVGPIVPVVTPAAIPVKPPVSAEELLKPTPKAPAAVKPVFLKGRLEEVQGNGANLPVGLLLGLKAQKAKSDPSGQIKPKADQLKGLVASFPKDWEGNWGGSLSVWWTQIDPTYWQWDRDNAQATAEILKRGASGTTTFTFYQTGQQILVQPPRIAFPPRQSQQTQQVPSGNPMEQLLRTALTTTMPVVVLGEYQGKGVADNQLDSRLMKNDIKQLKPGVLEENIIVQERERKVSGEIKNSFSETVIRFTKTNASQLYVQAASIKYRSDGHFLEKVIFYGTVNRGQTTPDPSNPFAGGFPGMGSMPGMPTSGQGGAGGMGGLDGLNNLIKQLQNGLQ